MIISVYVFLIDFCSIFKSSIGKRVVNASFFVNLLCIWNLKQFKHNIAPTNTPYKYIFQYTSVHQFQTPKPLIFRQNFIYFIYYHSNSQFNQIFHHFRSLVLNIHSHTTSTKSHIHKFYSRQRDTIIHYTHTYTYSVQRWFI